MKRVIALLWAVVTTLLIANGDAVDGKEQASKDAVPVKTLSSVFDVERPGDADILVLRNGDKLTGAIRNESFTITTPYGKIKFNNRAIAGIDLDGGINHMESIITVNNNRFSGFIEEPAFLFKLEQGPQVEIRREKALIAIFRVREAEVEGLPRRRFIVLKNGDFFSGKVLNDDLFIATPFARVPLTLSDVESITFRADVDQSAEVMFTNGDTLTGSLESEDLYVELDIGPSINVYMDRIHRVYGAEGLMPETTAPVQTGPVITGPVIKLEGNDKIGYGAEFKKNRLIIVKITDGSPAEKAGLRLGDQIFSIDGQQLTADDAVRNVRDDILKGKREDAMIGIQRGDQTIMFRLTK